MPKKVNKFMTIYLFTNVYKSNRMKIAMNEMREMIAK